MQYKSYSVNKACCIEVKYLAHNTIKRLFLVVARAGYYDIIHSQWLECDNDNSFTPVVTQNSCISREIGALDVYNQRGAQPR